MDRRAGFIIIAAAASLSEASLLSSPAAASFAARFKKGESSEAALAAATAAVEVGGVAGASSPVFEEAFSLTGLTESALGMTQSWAVFKWLFILSGRENSF